MIEDILQQLNIKETGEQNGNAYIINISTYDMFSGFYNKLEKSLEITKDSNESYMSESKVSIIYYGDDYTINLRGDFDKDIYELKITMDKEEEDN